MANCKDIPRMTANCKDIPRMTANCKDIPRMTANCKDILRVRLLQYCIPSSFSTYQQVLGWLEVEDSSELVVGDIQVDQVGQGTQHTEALVCREETECEVSVCVCVCGGGGGGRPQESGG